MDISLRHWRAQRLLPFLLGVLLAACSSGGGGGGGGNAPPPEDGALPPVTTPAGNDLGTQPNPDNGATPDTTPNPGTGGSSSEGGTSSSGGGSSGGGSSGAGSSSGGSSSGGSTIDPTPIPTPTPSSTRLTLIPPQARIGLNGELAFGAQLLDADGRPIDIVTHATAVTWSTENPIIATMSTNGAVRGQQIGATQIGLSLRYNGSTYNAAAELIVASDVSLRALAVAPSRAVLRVGEQRVFTLRAYGANGIDTNFTCAEPRQISFSPLVVNATLDTQDATQITINMSALAPGVTPLVVSCGGVASYPVAIEVTTRPPLPPLSDTPASTYGMDVTLTARGNEAVIASFEESQQRAVYHSLQGEWQAEFPGSTGAHGRHAQLALDPLRNQLPTLCGADGEFLACWLRDESGAWNKITVGAWPNGSGPEQRLLRMTSSLTGVVSLLYYNPTTSTLHLALSRTAARNDWSTLTVAHGALQAMDLALAPDDHARIALLRSDGIYFGAATSPDTWQFERVDANVGNAPMLALHIAVTGQAQLLSARGDGLWRAVKQDTTWSNQRILTTVQPVRALDLVVDSANVAHAVYIDHSANAVHLGTEVGLSIVAPTGWVDDIIASGASFGPDLELALVTGNRAAVVYRHSATRTAQLFIEPPLLQAWPAPSLPPSGHGGSSVQQPAVPRLTGLTATSGNSSIALRWTALPNALHYNVYWSTASGVTTARNAIKQVVSSAYNHLNLANGTAYYYAVSAVGELGESALSNEASATPLLPAPLNLRIDGAAGANRISWDAVPQAQSYTVYWNTAGSPTTNDASAVINDGNTFFNHAPVAPTTPYYYAVRASDANSDSALSTTVGSLTPPQAADAQVPYQDGSIELNWNAVLGATAYKIYVSETPGIDKISARVYQINSTTFWHNDLAHMSTWYYAVSALNADGESALSNETTNIAIVNNGPLVWRRATSLLSAKFLFASAAANGLVYAIGGYNGATTLSTVEAYSPDTDTWQTVKPLTTPRRELVAVGLNNLIYAFGGWDGNGIVDLASVYDPITNTWRNLAPMPTARSDFAGATVNGKIYVFGGFNGSYLNKAEVYDPATNRWSSLPAMPSARTGLASAVIGSNIYLIGGWSPSAPLNTVDVFDTSTNTWSAAPAMPTARNRLITAGLNGKIYAIGGWNDDIALNTVEVYDPRTSSWTIGIPMPTARHGIASTLLNNRIYAMGGWSGSKYVNNVETLGPE